MLGKRAKKLEIEELKGGVCFEPVQAILKRQPERYWTVKHAAQAMSWVINEAWTQQRLYDMCRERTVNTVNAVPAAGTEKHRL